MKPVSFLISYAVISCLMYGLSAEPLFAQTQAPTSPVAPAVKPPNPPSPSGAAPVGSTTSPASPTSDSGPSKAASPAAYIATRFEEASYKQRAEAGNPILLIFSHASDAIWQRQAPALQGILREPEFGRIAVFQIDIGAYPALAERFLVSSPGTLLIMKDGFERLRSTRMVKADVIRKMLRLHTAL